MSRLPVCSGAEAVQAFRRIGYQVDHQTGSHLILRLLDLVRKRPKILQEA